MKMAGMAQVMSHRDASHAGNAMQRLNTLRKEGILCDLTIIVEGREYKAHKAVMAACSDYFLNAIHGGKTTVTFGDNGNVTVDLEHVTLRGFAPLLEYAYTANLQVNASDVIDVLSAASYMQMFKVAGACSEFMRSNLLWAQSLPRLANLPLMPPRLLNGPKHGSDNRTLSPVPSGPPDVSTLLKATAASRAAMGQPPLLIPIHSMAYDVGLQQLAASMAGTQNMLSRTPGMPQQGMTPIASSPVTRNTNQSPQHAWPTMSSPRISPGHPQEAKRTPSPKQNGYSANERTYNSTNHGSSGRKSFAVKIESRSDDDEDSRSSSNGIDARNGQVKSVSPTGSEPIEDSWQALQKMYSMRMSESQSRRHHPYMPRSDDKELSRSRTPDFRDRNTPTKEMNMENSRSPLSDGNNNNNNNNSQNGEKAYADFISRSGIVKSPADLLSGGVVPSPNVHQATAAAINGAMRNALLQQHQLMTAQQNGQDPSKLVTLPAVPPTGYQSVRRRTLQSTVPKPHQCQICGSRFTRFHNLKQHIKLHSGIKPYECDECGKRFTRNYTLRLHKMKHVGIRNFRCGTCEASFTSLGEFRAHLRLTMHSHVTGTPPLGSQSPSAGNSEPEDLSSPMSMIGAATSVPGGSKYPGYEASLLNFQRGFLDDRASLLTAALSGAMAAREGNESMGSSVGSPQISERSVSPEDLSTKKSSMKTESFEENMQEDIEKNDAEKYHVPDEENEYSHNDESKLYVDESVQEKDQEQVTETNSAHGSPTHEHADSSSSEREGGDLYDREPSSGPMDRDSEQEENVMADDACDTNNNTNNTSKTEQPMSLVVNASA